MARETVALKAERYLAAGRLTVLAVDDNRVDARCKGDSGHSYRVVVDHGLWDCTCPAKGRCAHMHALARVVALPGQAGLR